MNSDQMSRFLDSAERALQSSGGGRRESETSFLQRLIRELGGNIFSPEFSPAALFRAAVKDWPLMRNSHLLEIVARPLTKLETPLRAGDWMLRVVPGTGDVGHVAVLASNNIAELSALAAKGIAAEGSWPGYYGVVIEAGTFPHSPKEPFARRFLDGHGRVPAGTVILRPRFEYSDSSEGYRSPAWLKTEQRTARGSAEPYLDLGEQNFTAASAAEGSGDRVVHVRVNDLAHPLGSKAILRKVTETYANVGIKVDVQFGSFVKQDFSARRDHIQITILSPNMDADDENAIRDAFVNQGYVKPDKEVAQTVSVLRGTASGFSAGYKVDPLAKLIFIKEITPQMRRDLSKAFSLMYPNSDQAAEALDVYFYADTIIHELGHTFGLDGHTGDTGNYMYAPPEGRSQYDRMTDLVSRPQAQKLMSDPSKWGRWVKNELSRSERSFTQDQVQTMETTLKHFIPSEGWGESQEPASDGFTPPSWLKIERRTQPRKPYLDPFRKPQDGPSPQESFDPSTIPPEVADALGKKDWPKALELALKAGWHDENDLTDLIFFNRHPDLPIAPLDPGLPKIRRLQNEWRSIRDSEIRPAIEKASADSSLQVSGNYVAERDSQFWGKTGQKFKELVEWAATEVDINPGFLAAVLLAEWDQSSTYMSGGEVRSFLSGTDDFFEARAQLAANVPAFSKVHFDVTKKTTNINEHGRVVTTIPFNSGKDATLATAVYLKYAEIKLRKGMKKNGGDFDSLPAETRFALVRIAMAAGHGGIDTDGTLIRFKKKNDQWVAVGKGETGGVLVGVATRLERVLKGQDILIRVNEPRGEPTQSAHITDRNATILAAQALHLSDWIFGKPQTAQQPGVKESENWSESQEPASDRFTPPSWLKIEQRARHRYYPSEFEDTEDFTYEPTGKQTDFGPKLREAWHAMIRASFQMNIGSVTSWIGARLALSDADAARQLRFFSAASHPPGISLTRGNITWRAFPTSSGSPSPAVYSQMDQPLLQRQIIIKKEELVRRQDEYCEWEVVRDDKTNKITRVVFTSEPPEYCMFLYETGVPTLKTFARNLLIRIYQRRCDETAIKLSDLETTDDDGNTVYDPGNRWNNKCCVHLQQPNNTLGAEINIAALAAIVRKQSSGTSISDISELLKCSLVPLLKAGDAFGEPSRQSDPAIGSKVNQLARENRFITLENPVGLYMASLDTSGWTTPDGTDAQEFWHVINGIADKDPSKAMIVRAEYKVPASKGYTVSDIKIGGVPIGFGGQIAEHLEMRLGAAFGPKDIDLDGRKLAPLIPVGC